MPSPTERGAAEHLAALQALLPRGAAWPRDASAALTKIARGIATPVARLHARASALLADAFPATALELLPEWEETVGLPDPCVPRDGLYRAGPATYFDAAGVLRTAPADTARHGYDPVTLAPVGLIVELEGRNHAPNPRAEGFVAGSPGTVPADWGGFTGSVNGLTRTIVGTGTEDGIFYVEARWAGTPTATGSIIVRGVPNTGAFAVPAAAGQTWTYGVFLRLVAGSLAGLVNSFVGVNEWDAGGAFIAGVQSFTLYAPSTAPLRTQRPAHTRVLTSPSCAFVAGQFGAGYTAGVPVDLTLRIGMPHLVPGTALGTPIPPPPPGSPGVSTRAADVVVVTPVATRRARVAARLSARGGQSVPYLVAYAASLGFAVTVTEFAPARAGVSRAGDPCNGEAWAHTLRVNAPEQTVTYARAGQATAGEPLAAWGNAALECALSRVRPAHAVIQFAYGS